MLKDQIVVGRSYVNEAECIVREVVEEVDRRRVKFNTFELVTGKLMPTRHNVSDKDRLARWADRETDASEAARLHRYGTGAPSGMLSSPDEAGRPLEQARAALDEMPSHHTFPVGK